MNPSSRDEAGRLRRYAEAENIAALYAKVGPFLLRLLTRQFAMPADEAEPLVRSIFLILPDHVDDPRKWLMAAACNSARTWQGRRAGEGTTPAGPPGATAEEIAAAHDLLSAPQATATEQGLEAVRLRFHEFRTSAEIAAELDLSEFYAQRLIEKTLARAWAVQRRQLPPDEPR